MAKAKQLTKPWVQRLFELIDDGDWHDYQGVVHDAADRVPTLMGFNKAEYYRQYHYKRAGKQVTERKHGQRADTVRTGQRMVLSKSIQALIRSKRVEVRYTNGQSRAHRRKPVEIRKSP